MDVSGAVAGTSAMFGRGGAIAATNSFGSSGFATFGSARIFGAAMASFLDFVLVSSAFVRSPGDRSVIIARKLLALSSPGSPGSSIPMRATMPSGAPTTNASAAALIRIVRRRRAAARLTRRARPLAFKRRPEREDVAGAGIQNPTETSRTSRDALGSKDNH